jgi:hypothetical protein
MTTGWTNEVTKKAWPRWMVSPTGDRAVVHSPGDIPPDWKLETPLTPDQFARQPGGDPRDAQFAAMQKQIEELSALLGKKAKAA